MVCRIVCGLTRLLLRDGIRGKILWTYLSTIVWMPNRVIGSPRRLRNTRPVLFRMPMRGTSSATVCGHSGQRRSLSPFLSQNLAMDSMADPPVEGSQADVDGCGRLPTSLFDQATDLDQQLSGFSALQFQLWFRHPYPGAIDARPVAAYSLSNSASNDCSTLSVRARISRSRWLVEKGFGWLKQTGPMRQVKLRGLHNVDWLFVFSCAAHNLMRLPRLIAQRAEQGLRQQCA